MSRKRSKELAIPKWRYYLVLLLLLCLPFAAVWHIASLQVVSSADRGYQFLQGQGDARMVRTESIPAYRGVITDRRGEPLAVSTPVVSIAADPSSLDAGDRRLAELAGLLDLDYQHLLERLNRYRNKEFMYLARHLTPAEAADVIALGIKGIRALPEYKRFYPAGEVTAQLVGFTNVDDQGQEGIELAYEKALSGKPGAKRVVKDRRGQVIKDIGLIESEKPGTDVALSIDLRLQYLAYRELKDAVKRFKAESGSVVMLDVQTGEVLAMVNQPSYNPNNRIGLSTNALRNRAITDLIEPGSTMKPLTMAAALESGKFTPHTPIETAPGYIWAAGKTFQDHSNYGLLDLTGILTKSSQVGTTKVALELEPDYIRDMFYRLGIGQPPGTGFPGESPGYLPERRKWRPIEHITMAFGYGLSATPLQVARAYATIANDGRLKPVSLLRVRNAPEGEQVLDPDIARQLREMLITVTQKGGTATRAAIAGYTVAGKTGTSHKVGPNGYEPNRYVGLFAGMVPADNPRLVTVVVINDPRGEDYFGGLVAAPVYARVTADALRLLRVPPDTAPASQLAEQGDYPQEGDRS
ncbi:MAG: cell division protein [Porticoccaceae bacterium]|nr:cell division protein [Porticoccaceae bacterium]